MVRLSDEGVLDRNIILEASRGEVVDYLQKDLESLQTQIQGDINQPVSQKSISKKILKQIGLLAITAPITFSYIVQTNQFFNENKAQYPWLSSLEIPATVASPLLNLLLSQFWLKDVGFARYSKALLISSFLWASVAGLPSVKGAMESMDKLGIGNEYHRDIFAIWLATANSVMFIKPVASVIRQLSSLCCLSEEKQRKFFYTPEGYCRDSVDKLLSELSVALRYPTGAPLNEIDKIFFLMAVKRAVAKKINEGNGGGLVRYNPLIECLEQNSDKFDKHNSILYGIAMLLSLGYAYGSLPDIANVLDSAIFKNNYDCSDRLTTAFYFPATIPNLFFDAICVYQAWIGMSLIYGEAFKKTPCINMFSIVGSVCVSILTTAPSMLQASLCSAYSPIESKIYQGVTLIDTASVNFTGLTDEDINLKIFMAQFALSCVALWSLKEMYDNVEFESVGLLLSLYALQVLEKSIHGMISYCRNSCAEYRDSQLKGALDLGESLNYDVGSDADFGSNDYDITLKVNSLLERVKIVKNIDDDLKNRLFNKSNDGPRSYYQNGNETGFFEILDTYMQEPNIPEAAPVSINNPFANNPVSVNSNNSVSQQYSDIEAV